VHWSGILIRKSARALLMLLVVAVIAVLFGRRLPTSFLPQEDPGYIYVNVQRPFAASLDRTEGKLHIHVNVALVLLREKRGRGYSQQDARRALLHDGDGFQPFEHGSKHL